MDTKTQSVLEEAIEIVNGERAQAYGDSNKMLQRIADLWKPILKDAIAYGDPEDGAELWIDPRHVALCLIQLKVAREVNAPKRDNAVDIAGYAEILARAQASAVEKPVAADPGLNLHEAAGAKLLDKREPGQARSGKEATTGQSESRTHRPGENKPVQVTVETAEFIKDVLRTKQPLVDNLLPDTWYDHVLKYIATGGQYKPASPHPGEILSRSELVMPHAPETNSSNGKMDSENLKSEATETKSEATPAWLETGRWVRIKKGPFAGQFAKVDYHIFSAGEHTVRMQVFKVESARVVPVDEPVDNLEPLIPVPGDWT